MVSTQKWSSTTVFNIDNNQRCSWAVISILEWFLKINVTLKTAVMMIENTAVHHRNKLQLTDIHIETAIRNCNTFTRFYYILDKKKALVSRRDLKTFEQ